MSKFIYFIFLGGLVLAALLIVNVNTADADEETKVIQFSVLAEDQADYGVDDNFSTIPAVSPSIIEDKVHDVESASSIPTIKYTTLPAETSETTHEDNDDTVDQGQNKNKDKDKDKDKDKENNGNGTPVVGGTPGNGTQVVPGNTNNNGNQDKNKPDKNDKQGNNEKKKK